MEKSKVKKSMVKKSKAKKIEYNYIINSHGSIVISNDDYDGKRYMAINIPENVELFTYTNIGQSLFSCYKKNYFICDTLDKFKDSIYPENIETPTHKYKYKQDTRNIFPEVILQPDSESVVKFYSGILHCIPHKDRTTKAMEVIYNMDAVNMLDCTDDSIGKYYKHAKTEDKYKLYITNKTYSKEYKELIEKPENKRKPPLNTINKCGPILLSDAIKLIQDHCSKTYSEDYKICTIKIYLSCCLNERDIESYERSRNYYLSASKEEGKETIIRTRLANNASIEPQPPPLTDEEIERLYYKVLDLYKLNAKSKINDDLYTYDLEEFAKNLDFYDVLDAKNTSSYLEIYLGIEVKLITSKTSISKYENINAMSYYYNILHDALQDFNNYLLDWRKSFSDLPKKITVDVTEFEKPIAKNILDKLILFIIDNKFESFYEYTWNNGEDKMEVHLLHDIYLENFEKQYNTKIVNVITNLYPHLKKIKIEPEVFDIFDMVNKVEMFLYLSQLNQSDTELFYLLWKQIVIIVREITGPETEEETEEETELKEAEARAKQHKDFIRSVREDTEATAREEVARVEAERARVEAERARVEAEKARVEAEKAAEKEAEKTAREAEKTAREAEKTAREAEKEAIVAEKTAIVAEKEAKTKRTLTQRFMSFFTRRSRRVAPAPMNAIATGIKTKFKRKHKRRITRRNISKYILRNHHLSKIKIHSIPSNYEKKTFKKTKKNKNNKNKHVK
jgi:hypothetical protein